MYYDLNIPFRIPAAGADPKPQRDARRKLRSVLLEAIQMGYSAVALNYTVDVPGTIPAASTVIPDSEELFRILDEAEADGIAKNPDSVTHYSTMRLSGPVSSAASSSSSSSQLPPCRSLQLMKDIAVPRPLKIFKRLTLKFSDPNLSLHLRNPNVATWDLLGAFPCGEKACNAVMATPELFDIILLYTNGTALDVKMNHQKTRALMRKGCFFEICYAPALRDVKQQHVFFKTVHKFQPLTLGRSTLYSSEAVVPADMRAPNDLEAISLALGHSVEQSQSIPSVWPRAAVLHGEGRKLHRNALKLEKKETKGSSQKRKQMSDEVKPVAPQQQQGGKGKRQKNQE